MQVKRYFTSDLHYFDEGILWYCDRPYGSTEEMHRKLQENFLEMTQDADEVYMLGDICTGISGWENRTPVDFSLLRKALLPFGIGKKPFYLLRGNHDVLPEECYLELGFRSVLTRLDLEIAGQKTLLCHDPALAQRPDTLCICGHVHRLFEEVYNSERNILAINVGVDVRGYKPVSEEMIVDIMEKHRFLCTRSSSV